MKKIGLTGIMGAGKSTVIEILKQFGITVLDCDKINHDLLKVNERGWLAITVAFGKAILTDDQEIDRQRFASVIFQDDKKRKQLEEIMHPMIQEVLEEKYVEHACEHMIVVEVPLLYEIHWEDRFDEVWVVAASKKQLLQRLKTYRGVSEQAAKQRWMHQIDQDEKCEKANRVIYNDGSILDLKQQIEQLLKEVKQC